MVQGKFGLSLFLYFVYSSSFTVGTSKWKDLMLGEFGFLFARHNVLINPDLTNVVSLQ